MELLQRFAVKWIRQVGQALALCHDRRLLHRDVRPENIFLTETEDVRLGDFGVAGVMDHYGKAEITGHEEARAPELFWGYASTTSSDIWSLGATLWTALTGVMPPRDGGHNVCAEIRDLSPHVSQGLGQIVRKAINSSPADRYTSVRELDQALARVTCGSRDFMEIAPHDGHLRCWSGQGVGTVRPVLVCVLSESARRVHVTARYVLTGRRITEFDASVPRSSLTKYLRSVFVRLR